MPISGQPCYLSAHPNSRPVDTRKLPNAAAPGSLCMAFEGIPVRLPQPLPNWDRLPSLPTLLDERNSTNAAHIKLRQLWGSSRCLLSISREGELGDGVARQCHNSHERGHPSWRAHSWELNCLFLHNTAVVTSSTVVVDFQIKVAEVMRHGRRGVTTSRWLRADDPQSGPPATEMPALCSH